MWFIKPEIDIIAAQSMSSKSRFNVHLDRSIVKIIRGIHSPLFQTSDEFILGPSVSTKSM